MEQWRGLQNLAEAPVPRGRTVNCAAAYDPNINTIEYFRPIRLVFLVKAVK